MKTKIGILTILLLGLCFAGCNKDSTLPEQTEQQKVYLYVNTFAFNRINQYYLWNEEVAAALKDWKTADEPIAKVQSVRYRDDRWTLLTDDVDSFYDSTTGHRKGFGFEVGIDLSAAQLIVLYTYAGSPAEEAGLKRGDSAKAVPTYASLGMGVKFAGVHIDAAFLTASQTLGNTLMVGLGYSF